MHRIEDKLKPLLLRNVEFIIDNKVTRMGKITVFNTKQFFIKFKLETEQGSKEYEVPYPFALETTPQGYVFNYALTAFVPPTEESYWKMKLIDSSNSSKLYNNYLFVNLLSSH